jgi:hypothetical protein
MNFERHTDTKEALGIGRKRIALELFGISIKMADPDKHWHEFYPAGKENTHKLLSMIRDNHISKKEVLKCVDMSGSFRKGFIESLNDIRVEFNHRRSSLKKLQDAGETHVKTVMYDGTLYEVSQESTIFEE